jgi:putative DNA primase/helicase
MVNPSRDEVLREMLVPPALTDLGNAERLVRDYRGQFLWVEPWRSFLTFDGLHWVREELGAVARMAKATVRRIHADAAYEDDDATRKKLAVDALKSESEPAIRRMLELAKSDLAVAAHPSQFDTNLTVLNTPTGVVDLKIGQSRPARPEDFFTRITAAPYVPDMRHPVFDRFLEKVLPDAALLRTDLLGLRADGLTTEEELAFAYGPTEGGKSTLLRALRSALGNYAAVADVATFTERKHDGGPKEEIARLAGTRAWSCPSTPRRAPSWPMAS